MKTKEEILEVIESLVQLKKWKDKHGKDEHYLNIQPLVWQKAFNIVAESESKNFKKADAIKSVCVDCGEDFEQMQRCIACENNKGFPM